MNRRSLVRIVSYSLSIALVTLIFSYKTANLNKRYVLEIENNYSYMLDELTTATNNISTILNKIRFSTTPSQISGLSSQLLTEAELSKNSLSQLPIADELATLNKFFSQVGNYAMYVSNTLFAEGKVNDKHTANIEKLSDTADRVADIISLSRERYNNLEYWAKAIDKSIDEAVDGENLDSALGEIEEKLKDYPTLIYDGPYSDHLLNEKVKMLENSKEVSQRKAKETACYWSGLERKDLEYAGNSKGKIETYDFLGDGITVSVTKKGGYVLFLRKEKNVKDITLNYEKALNNAKKFLEEKGLNNMEETYYSESDGICTVNFAFADGITVCYTDLIKVGVAMDSGEVVLYEAGGYISNHKDRAFETPKYTEEQAQKLISPKLTVENIRLALIPTNSTEEKRCYEFNCESADGQNILVYINTATLKEEEILILLKSDGGILVK